MTLLGLNTLFFQIEFWALEGKFKGNNKPISLEAS